MDEDERQEIIDAEQLRLLRIGYFISAGFAALFVGFGLSYAMIGFAVGSAPFPTTGGSAPDPAPEVFRTVFGLFGFSIAFIAICVAAARLYVARCLARRKAMLLCMIVAALGCIEIPFGCALGVCTFLVLSRPSVDRLFSTAPGA